MLSARPLTGQGRSKGRDALRTGPAKGGSDLARLRRRMLGRPMEISADTHGHEWQHPSAEQSRTCGGVLQSRGHLRDLLLRRSGCVNNPRRAHLCFPLVRVCLRTGRGSMRKTTTIKTLPCAWPCPLHGATRPHPPSEPELSGRELANSSPEEHNVDTPTGTCEPKDAAPHAGGTVTPSPSVLPARLDDGPGHRFASARRGGDAQGSTQQR
jgi:hypothetical protein